MSFVILVVAMKLLMGDVFLSFEHMLESLFTLSSDVMMANVSSYR